VWTDTAVVLVAGSRHAFAEATAEGLWLQVSPPLLGLGVVVGERRLLVLGDGAPWVRTWFEGLGISPISMRMMDRTALASETLLSKESTVSGENDPGNGCPLDRSMPILYITMR
jgi:hypothetical protein